MSQCESFILSVNISRHTLNIVLDFKWCLRLFGDFGDEGDSLNIIGLACSNGILYPINDMIS